MKRLHRPLLIVWLGLVLAAPAWSASKGCCVVPAGTPIKVELAEDVGTKIQKAGDTFALRLAEPLVVDGRVVIPAGARGEGMVVESAKPGFGGKGAKLVLSARYLRQGGVRIPLQSLQLSASGKANTTEAQAAGLGGIAFAPLGFVGLAVKGGDVTFPAGTVATAKLAAGTALPSLGPAPKSALPATTPTPVSAPSGAIPIPPPPPGMGQVVFFRKKSLMGTGQWFNVRENGAALGKLSNGTWFRQVTVPGLHVYTAKAEPEFNDRLRLQVDAGETYFVEGTLTKAVVIGAADLAPSSRQAFDAASKTLKAAAPSGGGE